MGCTRWCRWRSTVTHLIDCRPLAQFVDAAGMCALTGLQSRRLARFGGSVCGATDLVLGWPGACLPRHPPHPPTRKTRPTWGQPERGKDESTAFFFWGVWRVRQKPVDLPKKLSQVVDSLSKTPPRVASKSTRVVSFLPRVGSFCPRVDFCRFALFLLYLSLSSLVKKRERGGKRRQTLIHGFLTMQNLHPRVCYKNNSYSVDEIANPWMVRLYKSITCVFPPGFPRSTGKNAYTPVKVGSQ